MDPSLDAAHYQRLVAPTYAGRRWLLAVEAVAAATRFAASLRGYGAERSFILAGTVGTGPLPDADDAEWVVLGTRGDSAMSSIRAYEAALGVLPDEVVERIDAWDPDASARVLTAPYAVAGTIAGRATYGTRPSVWAALEDKTTVDALWDAAGVARAPAEVVPAETASLLDAAARLDGGSGTVWVADNREGWHGGAEMLRWVRHQDPASEAARFFAQHAGRVRVMPFLEGIPCSIHGMVIGEEVLAFRPVEMVIFRTPGSDRLRYASTATFWDPPDADREAMRRAARAVGAVLAGRHGLRGVFTIDGVITADGFRPTELNPRFGVGLATVVRGAGDLPLGAIHRALIEGEELDYRPADLEALVVASGDAVRAGGGFTMVEPVQESNRTADVVFRAGRCRVTAADEAPEATMTLGPAAAGGALQVELDPDLTPKGPSVGGRVAAAFALADEMWGTGIGPLQPSPSVR